VTTARTTGRWLVTGSSGQLGHDLVECLQDRDVVGLSRSELDVTDADAVADAVARASVVVNTASYTAVDAAEDDEANARQVNAEGAANLARACARHGSTLVHISTDYVFDGNAESPYEEDAATAPQSAYGRSKAEGEQLVLRHAPDAYVVRTAWLYGVHGSNFVRTMMRLEDERDELAVVDDQRGQPTWSRDLAQQVIKLVDASAPTGIYHGTSSGETTWFGLARALFEELGADPERVRATTSAEFQRPAPRPAYSVLGHRAWEQAGIPPIRHWRDALSQAVPLFVRNDAT
jgi:dTDP-4-dehydrorhamnose reductase